MAQKTRMTFDWKEILSKVYKRAATDHEFHTLCLKDPHAAIKQVSGKEIPKNFKIRFVDESEEIVFMLPAENKNRAEQLSDAQLEALAGGFGALAGGFGAPSAPGAPGAPAR